MFGLPRHCPRCHSSLFFASRSGTGRRLLALLLIRPFRCGRCDRRVWRLSPLTGEARSTPGGPGQAARHPISRSPDRGPDVEGRDSANTAGAVDVTPTRIGGAQ